MSVILVVDDDPVAQVTFKARLKKKGYLVLATGSATEALAYMTADSRPDLILLDVHMPFVNGFEFARNLKAGRQAERVGEGGCAGTPDIIAGDHVGSSGGFGEPLGLLGDRGDLDTHQFFQAELGEVEGRAIRVG